MREMSDQAILLGGAAQYDVAYLTLISECAVGCCAMAIWSKTPIPELSNYLQQAYEYIAANQPVHGALDSVHCYQFASE